MQPTFASPAFIIARCIAAGFAFYATARHPYIFYLLTRWVVFFTCCWGVVFCSRRFWTSAAPAYILGGIIFNPLLPFHFTRGAWHILDIAAGALLLLTLLFDDYHDKVV